MFINVCNVYWVLRPMLLQQQQYQNIRDWTFYWWKLQLDFLPVEFEILPD